MARKVRESMGKAKTYTVRYERDDSGDWNASIPEVDACYTYGKSIRQARKRIREVLALCLDDDAAAEAAELVDDVKLPAIIIKSVKGFSTARAALATQEDVFRMAQTRAVKALVDDGVSLRDAGEVLGVSFQRVQQIASSDS